MDKLIQRIALVALVGLSGTAGAQEKQMQELLRPWLDLSFTKETGTDSNVKELVATVTPEIQAAVPIKLSALVTKKRRVLVLTANTLGALHAPGAAGLLVVLREAGKKFGDVIEFTEVFSENGLDSAALAKYDAVVLNNISQIHGGKNADFYNVTLPAYVRQGGGVLAAHGTALLFRQQPAAEFNKLLGGFTTEPSVHPGKHGSSFPVKINEPNNPLTAAFRGPKQEVNTQGQWLAGVKRVIIKMQFTAPGQLADELYTFNLASNADGASRVLVSIDHAKLGAGKPGPVFPDNTPEFGYALIWTKSYGKGRVFYTQFGHNFSVFSVHCVAQSTLDGLQYAAGDLKEEN